MTATAYKHTKAPMQTSAASRFARSLHVIAATCTLSLTLLVSGAVAIDIGLPPKEEKRTKKPKIDTKVCNVTPALITGWIGGNTLTVNLNKAYQDLVDDWGQLGDDKFGHANATNIVAMKKKALKLINGHRTALYDMAAEIQSNLNPACDKCRLLNAWGKVKFVAKLTRLGKKSFKSKSLKVSDFSQTQMRNEDLIKAVNEYITINELLDDVNIYPATADQNKQTELYNACQAEFVKNKNDYSKIDKTKCHIPYVEKTLKAYAEGITEELKTTFKKTDPKMNKLIGVTCLPSSTYDHIFYARIP